MNKKATIPKTPKNEISKKTYPSKPGDKLLDETLKFFLEALIMELSHDIDLRAKGYGKNTIKRIFIYFIAFLRDLARIPLHYYRGVGQAQFRFRVYYIINTAIPTLNFFLKGYPLEEKQCHLIEESIDLLQKGANLLRNGSIPTLDEWYATMEEFYQLTEYSKEAAKRLDEVIKT